jgi:hypothetical protein
MIEPSMRYTRLVSTENDSSLLNQSISPSNRGKKDEPSGCQLLYSPGSSHRPVFSRAEQWYGSDQSKISAISMLHLDSIRDTQSRLTQERPPQYISQDDTSYHSSTGILPPNRIDSSTTSSFPLGITRRHDNPSLVRSSLGLEYANEYGVHSWFLAG